MSMYFATIPIPIIKGQRQSRQGTVARAYQEVKS